MRLRAVLEILEKTLQKGIDLAAEGYGIV